MARCAFSFWPWAAAPPGAWRADRTRRNIVNQLRVDNIGQRFFMTVRPEESEKRRGIPVNTAGGCDAPPHVCIHEIFTTGDIYESLDRRGILSSPKKKSAIIINDHRSSRFLFLFFCSCTSSISFHFILFPLWNSFEFEIVYNDWNLWSRTRFKISFLSFNFAFMIIHTDYSIDNNMEYTVIKTKNLYEIIFVKRYRNFKD